MRQRKHGAGLDAPRSTGTPPIKELEVAGQPGSRVRDRLVAMHVLLLVFHGAPQPFDEDIVAPAAVPVHADLESACDEDIQELDPGELTPLIGVEDLGAPEVL